MLGSRRPAGVRRAIPMHRRPCTHHRRAASPAGHTRVFADAQPPLAEVPYVPAGRSPAMTAVRTAGGEASRGEGACQEPSI
jgi:hypothetical protein